MKIKLLVNLLLLKTTIFNINHNQEITVSKFFHFFLQIPIKFYEHADWIHRCAIKRNQPVYRPYHDSQHNSGRTFWFKMFVWVPFCLSLALSTSVSHRPGFLSSALRSWTFQWANNPSILWRNLPNNCWKFFSTPPFYVSLRVDISKKSIAPELISIPFYPCFSPNQKKWTLPTPRRMPRPFLSIDTRLFAFVFKYPTASKEPEYHKREWPKKSIEIILLCVHLKSTLFYFQLAKISIKNHALYCSRNIILKRCSPNV